MKRLLGAALLLLSACAEKEVKFGLNIVTQSCAAEADPMAGVGYLWVRVTGDGMDPVIAIEPAANKILQIPKIPAGANRVIEVRGYDQDPKDSANVISVGKSRAFTVPDVVPDDLGADASFSVVLRRVNTFTPVVSVANPTECQRMRTKRAGHTATLMHSGKVLIAGGYRFQEGTSSLVALPDTEIYNPETGVIEAGQPLQTFGTTDLHPIARHAAALNGYGQVVLWGGETYNPTNGVPSPSAAVLLFDETTPTQYGSFQANVARSRHQLVVDNGGRVVAVGGIKNIGLEAADALEWINSDGTIDVHTATGISERRIGAAAGTINKGEYIAVMGGSDGSATTTDIKLYKYQGNTFAVNVVANLALAETRRDMAAVEVHDGTDVMLLGGYSDNAQTTTLPTGALLKGAPVSVSPGPSLLGGARGQSCAAALGANQVLSAGGRTYNTAVSKAKSSAVVEVMTLLNSGNITPANADPLPIARYDHSCTTLADGSVLVLGGINVDEEAGTQEILNDAYIFTPKPVD